jgi:hypothetical protein
VLDIATALYLSEAFYECAVEAAALSDMEDWMNASVAEDDGLEDAGYAVALIGDDEWTEALVDL